MRRRGTMSSLQLRSTAQGKKCAFMQTEVVFLGHIVGRTGLACDPAKLAAVRNWHAPDKVKGVRQFVGFDGYYRRFAKDFAELAEFLVALTRKSMPRVHPYPRFSHGGRMLCPRHGRQLVCCGRCAEPATERGGSGHCICQP